MACKHLFSALFFSFCLNSLTLVAQSISVASSTPPTAGTAFALSSSVAQYTLDAAWCSAAAPCAATNPCSTVAACSTQFFIMYGDGHFDKGSGYSLPFTHKYPVAGANYQAKAYFAKRKDIDPPALRTIDVIPSNGGTYTNSPNQMYGKIIKVGTSWLPVANQQHFVILTIANPCGNFPDGSVDFYFNSNQLAVTPAEFSNFNTGVLTNPTAISTTLYDSKCSFDYTGLLPGMQRSFFIPVTVQAISQGSTIHYKGVNNPKKYFCNGTGVQVSELNINTGLAAHDPNSKTVNIESICTNSPSVTLEYRIQIQNDGADFAGPIVIKDVLDDTQLDPLTVILTGSSDVCIYSYDPLSSNVATFTFPTIQLPGINQTIPEKYDPSETYCSFTFTVNTLQNLPAGILPNAAEVIFYPDGSSLETNIAEVIVQDYSDDNPNCEVRVRNAFPQKDKTPIHQLIATPNPFSNTLKITALTTPLDGTTQIQILDPSGRIRAQQTTFDEPEWNLQTADWPAGLYFIRIQTANEVAIHRVIKQ